MEEARRAELEEFYRSALLDNVMPFWTERSLDREHGGYLVHLDREGRQTGDGKYVWFQAREAWMFSALYNQLEPRREWLDAARLGADFLKRHGRASPGVWNYLLARDGAALEGPISWFSDGFALVALNEYARAAGDDEALDMALETFWSFVKRAQDPDYDSYFPTASVRTASRLVIPMFLLFAGHKVREYHADPRLDGLLDECLDRIMNRHVRAGERVLYETLSAGDMELLDTPEGRTLNPGHAIECMWFVMHEARRRGDDFLIQRAADVVEWMMERGWDDECGGMFAFVDVGGGEPHAGEWFRAAGMAWDTKIWWVHSEIIYSTLLAYRLTGRPALLDWFEKAHAWTFEHFADPDFPEWFSYPDRSGKPTDTSKGNIWKGAFHVPRSLFYCYLTLREMASGPEVA